MKTILAQVNDLIEHLDQSLLKRSKADELNNKALLRVMTEVTEIRAQIKATLAEVPTGKKGQGYTTTAPDDMDVDPQDNPIIIQSQSQPKRDLKNEKSSKVPGDAADCPYVIQSQIQPEREAKNGKPLKPKQTGWKPALVADETDEEKVTVKENWKPTVIPNAVEDAIGLFPNTGEKEEFANWRPEPKLNREGSAELGWDANGT